MAVHSSQEQLDIILTYKECLENNKASKRHVAIFLNKPVSSDKIFTKFRKKLGKRVCFKKKTVLKKQF